MGVVIPLSERPDTIKTDEYDTDMDKGKRRAFRQISRDQHLWALVARARRETGEILSSVIVGFR